MRMVDGLVERKVRVRVYLTVRSQVMLVVPGSRCMIVECLIWQTKRMVRGALLIPKGWSISPLLLASIEI